MSEDCQRCVLTLNSGSSSIKSAVYEMKPAEKLLFSGNVERIGLGGGRILLRDAEGTTLAERRCDFADHDVAIGALLDSIEQRLDGRPLWAVGHRLVHGGADCTEPRLITAALLETLETLRPLAPDHLPHELGVIRAVATRFPTLKQVACFDTAFHRDMPEVARASRCRAICGTRGCAATVFTVCRTSTSCTTWRRRPARRRPTAG